MLEKLFFHIYIFENEQPNPNWPIDKKAEILKAIEKCLEVFMNFDFYSFKAYSFYMIWFFSFMVVSLFLMLFF